MGIVTKWVSNLVSSVTITATVIEDSLYVAIWVPVSAARMATIHPTRTYNGCEGPSNFEAFWNEILN